MSRTLQDRPIRLVQITDCHLQARPDQLFKGCYPDARLDAVIAAVLDVNRRHGPFDHLVLSGDIAQCGAAQAYDRIMHKSSAVALRRHWVPGNHDDVQQMAKFAQMRHKVVHHGNWAIVLLDSTSSPDGRGSGSLSERELQFLESLQGLDAKYLLLVLHHPPVDVGSDWQDKIKLANSADFWSRVHKIGKVKAISFGHLHQKHDLVYSSIKLFCTPATAPQFKMGQKKVTLEDDTELSKPGFRILNLHANGTISTEVIRVG